MAGATGSVGVQRGEDRGRGLGGIIRLPHAQRVPGEWDAAWDAAERVKTEQRKSLAVGMSTSPGRGGMLPAIRSRFTAVHPGASLTLRQVGWDDSTAGPANGSSDVAFVWLPIPDAGRYAWIVVAGEPRLVAMPETHPLAGKEIIDCADLPGEPFLALPKSAGPLLDYCAGPTGWPATPVVAGHR